MPTPRKHDDVSLLTRTAYHEAGHTVLAASIDDWPELVSIRPRGSTLGRSRQRMAGRPEMLVQVYLAGFAAEHLLTSRRPLDLAREVRFALVARAMPDVGERFPDSMATDGHRAVQEILRMERAPDDDEIARAVDRFYDVARESLSVVSLTVDRVARSLLRKQELHCDELRATFADASVFAPFSRSNGRTASRHRGDTSSVYSMRNPLVAFFGSSRVAATSS